MSDDQFSERPPDSDFQQQNLKAWQPLLTPPWVIGTFTMIAIAFIPIGAVIISQSSEVVEMETRYDNLPCAPFEPEGALLKNTTINFDGGEIVSCWKSVEMEVTGDMTASDSDGKNIYFYYKLTNFYQNHRRYVKSRSDAQLRGEVDPATTSCDPLNEWKDTGNCDTDADCLRYSLSVAGRNMTCDGRHHLCTAGDCTNDADCDVFDNSSLLACHQTVGAGTVKQCQINTDSSDTMSLYPCGLIAASYFNDTYMKPEGIGGWTEKRIAWESDVEDKFKPSTVDYTKQTRVGPGNYQIPDVTDEAFIVWMRTAGLPTFKKLRYRITNATLKKGQKLTVNVYDTFQTAPFEGTKSIVISTTSWLGGKNLFLGYAYIVVGGLCLLFAIVFLIKHMMCRRDLGDMKYFNWENSRK